MKRKGGQTDRRSVEWGRTVVVAVLLMVGISTHAHTQLDRSAPPELGPPPAMQLPPVHEIALPNGLTVAVVEMREVPVVDVTLLVDAGSVRDPEDLIGLATFVANMLDEGAGGRSALELSEAVDFLGARLGTFATHDYAGITLHVPKRSLSGALDVMADVLLRPDLSTEEIERQRQLRATQILQQQDRPTTMASLAFAAIVFGNEHPYGKPINGTEMSTERLDQARVRAFYDAYYRPNGSKLLIVGDVSLAEVRELVTTRFGSWAARDVDDAQVVDAPAPGERTIYLVDKPGAAQSVIYIGHPGVARSTSDYASIQVLNTILGGSFTSRLNTNLRETKGYTYGARSSFSMRQMAGPFFASASVVTAKTDSSLIEFMKELRMIRDEAVPTAELDKAKSYVALRLPGRFETTQGAARQYRELLLYDLPLDYYNGLIPQIQAVTAADVQRAARRYIDPDHFAIIVVGDRSVIEEAIRALGEGPISLRDLYGKEIQ